MRVSKDPEERRQELIETATQLFLEQGYEKTIIKDIVNQANVTQGLFYYYFTSKEDILKAIADYYINMYQDCLRVAGFDDCQDAITAIKLILKVSIAYANQYRFLIEEIHKEGNEKFHDLIGYGFADAVAVIFEKVIILGNQTGLFHCTYPWQTASSFIFGLLYTIHLKEGGFVAEKILAEREFTCYYMEKVLGLEAGFLNHIFDDCLFPRKVFL